jgi:hypothetical protein
MKHIAALFVTLMFLACDQPHKKNVQTTKFTIKKIDTSRYALLKFNKQDITNPFAVNSKLATLSVDEIAEIENIISKRAISYNKHMVAFWDSVSKKFNKNKTQTPGMPYANTIDHPEKYYKQFAAIIDSNGDKIVWANCFCEKLNSDWKKVTVTVDDGGACFFQTTINLTKRIVINFYVNGVA